MDTARHRVVGINAAAIELANDGMVNLEINTILDRFHTRTGHNAETSAIGITMRIVVICICHFDVGSVNTRKIKLGKLTTHDTYGTMTGYTPMIIACMASRCKTFHPYMTTHDDVSSVSHSSKTSSLSYNLFKLTSIKNQRLLMVWISRHHVFELGSIHKSCFSNLKMSVWHKNTDSVSIFVVTNGQTQFCDWEEVETDWQYPASICITTPLELPTEIRLVVKVKVSTHEGHFFTIGIIEINIISGLHLEVAHQNNGLVVYCG